MPYLTGGDLLHLEKEIRVVWSKYLLLRIWIITSIHSLKIFSNDIRRSQKIY